MPAWIDRLKTKWNLKSTGQVLLVLLVFACTGFSVLFLKRPLFEYLGPDVQDSTVFTVLYYVLIFPIYNLILLFYGFIFGQFKFFWEFEKRFFQRVKGWFGKR